VTAARWRVAVWAGAVGYAWVASGFATFTWPAEVATLLPGFFLVIAAMRDRRPRAPLPSWLSGFLRQFGRQFWPTAWLLVVGALVAWELLTLFSGTNRYLHPTISSLTNQALAYRGGRFGLFVGWLWFGRLLARR
jgi:hypothetical protein